MLNFISSVCTPSDILSMLLFSVKPAIENFISAMTGKIYVQAICLNSETPYLKGTIILTETTAVKGYIILFFSACTISVFMLQRSIRINLLQAGFVRQLCAVLISYGQTSFNADSIFESIVSIKFKHRLLCLS